MSARTMHIGTLILILALSFPIILEDFAKAQGGDQLYRMGPSGGLGGHYFSDSSLPINSRVFEVRVRHGNWIDSIQIVHQGRDLRF